PAELEAVQLIGLRKHRQQRGAEVIVVAGVAAATDDVAAAVAEPGLVVDVPAASRHTAFGKRADEVHRQEATAKLNHLRPGDRGLQPLTVMERRVPVVDWRVVAAE